MGREGMVERRPIDVLSMVRQVVSDGGRQVVIGEIRHPFPRPNSPPAAMNANRQTISKIGQHARLLKNSEIDVTAKSSGSSARIGAELFGTGVPLPVRAGSAQDRV